MRTTKQLWMLFLAFGTTLFFTACEKEDDTSNSGTLRVEITDSPLEDARVEGVFVTVASVELNGEPLADFDGKQTIELSSYQNGDTRFLGSGEFEANSYNNLSLELDLDEDETGTGPGCYVLTTDGQRHPLSIEGNTSGILTIENGNFTISEGESTSIVIDFDLRKAIRSEDNGTDDQYDFVTAAELNTALRLADISTTGEIMGQVDRNGTVDQDARIVAYAYAAGTYDQNTETTPQGSGQTLFANAVASAGVDENGEYTIAFLNKGDYEVVFAAYEDENNDGESELKGTLEVGLLSNILVGPGILTVNAETSLSLSISVISVLP